MNHDNIYVDGIACNTYYGWQLQSRAVKWGSEPYYTPDSVTQYFAESQLCEGSCPF